MSAVEPTIDASPRVLIIRILEACDAGCFMCHFRWSRDQYRFPVSEARALAATAAARGIRVVRLTGGEPLLHENIVDLVHTFADAGLHTSVITNGGQLSRLAGELAAAGLSQVIVSLDGVEANHDRYRATEGLFRAATAGLRHIRRDHPSIRTRVNTVVGRHNYRELCALHDCLLAIGVGEWSLIPLKNEAGAWSPADRSDAEQWHERFRDHVSRNAGVRILGYGLDWPGRTVDERAAFFDSHKVMTPRTECGVVSAVRYYTPKTGVYHVCNCVPHRIGAFSLEQKWHELALDERGLGTVGLWLRNNGPTQCKGCEPINAALGEGAIDLSQDPLGF
jgi:cytosylglucuronate decarboxylase